MTRPMRLLDFFNLHRLAHRQAKAYQWTRVPTELFEQMEVRPDQRVDGWMALRSGVGLVEFVAPTKKRAHRENDGLDDDDFQMGAVSDDTDAVVSD